MISEPKPPETLQPPEKIREMFNEIAPTYDLLNHLMSFGMDIRWRKKCVKLLREKQGGTFLDIAAGSGDFSLELLALQPKLILATDFAEEMLAVFQQKLDRKQTKLPIQLTVCDALALPFDDGMFDGTVVAFGIRNFADRLVSLQEMIRVLKPGGMSIILELSRPEGSAMSRVFSVYAGKILPAIGRMISHHNSAYRYLPQSIADFPRKEEFLQLMRLARFGELQAIPLSFGVATIFVGRKASR